MPMYDTSYVAPPTPKQIADKELQDFYAKYIKEQNLFADLETLEAELEKSYEQFQYLKTNDLISDDEAYGLEEHLHYSKKHLETTRLIIEQLDRASRGEAYGNNAGKHKA